MKWGTPRRTNHRSQSRIAGAGDTAGQATTCGPFRERNAGVVEGYRDVEARKPST
jgi:hypothetical protein